MQQKKLSRNVSISAISTCRGGLGRQLSSSPCVTVVHSAIMATMINGSTTNQGSNFPEIVLDTTLAELLAEEPDYNVRESLCNMKPCADPSHKTVPVNKKYLITSTNVADSNDLAHLQMENVSYLLSFWAGKMEVPLVACEGCTDDDTLTRDAIDANARKSFSILTERQRPWPKYVTTPFCTKDYIC